MDGTGTLEDSQTDAGTATRCPFGCRCLASRRSCLTVRVWDAQSGERLGMIRGFRDVRAIAAGRQAFPWRALARGEETVIEHADTGQVVSDFPIALGRLATHPSGRAWAGRAGNYLCLIALEGGDTLPAGNYPQSAQHNDWNEH